MAPEKAVSVPAPAKINLYLHVVGRRADGYHLLDSLIAFVDVGDMVIARPADEFSLEITGPNAAALRADESNLVLRAARSLAGLTGAGKGARLTLVKNLPVAAGLGGGSSDAAAALAALSRLWNVRPEEAELMRLGEALGADVPVCIHGGPAHVSGIGEVIEPVAPLPSCGVVLANPNRQLSTAAVFAARRGPFGGVDPVPPKDRVSLQALAESLTRRRNDLAEPACGLAPEISEVLDALGSQPRCLLARLSGSGPTCFGLFADHTVALDAASRIAADHPSWWVRATRFTERRMMRQ